MKTAIGIMNAGIGYKRLVVATDLNLQLPTGRLTALIGRNGCGKSTLIRSIIGNLPLKAGTVSIMGQSLNEYNTKSLAKVLALINTDPHIAGGLKVKEMVGLGRIPYTGITGIMSAEDQQVIKESMLISGILHKQDSYLSELSDGEKQKAMIARGLAQQTPIIVMDEPFSYMDAASRLETLSLLRRLTRERGITILFSTHEVAEALAYVDFVWLFTLEEAVQGKPEELINCGKIDEIFPQEDIKFDHNTFKFYLCER